MEGPLRLSSRSADLVLAGPRSLEIEGVEVWETLVSVKEEARLDGETVHGLYPDRGLPQVLALHQHKPPWVRPSLHSSLGSLPAQTLFALARHGTDGRLAALCPLAASAAAALQGGRSGDDLELVLTCPGRAPQGPVLLVLDVPNTVPPAVATRWSAARVLAALPDRGRPEEEGEYLPEAFRSWGWCSWDAHGVAVRPEDLEAVARKHRPAWLVLDDGWQEEVPVSGGEGWLHRPQTRFLARPGFGGDLAPLAQSLQPSRLLVWHTLHGYWGGVAPGRGYAVRQARPRWPAGLRGNCAGEVAVWEGDFSVLETEEVARFYEDFYGALASAGVAGVKCDGQFLPELLVGVAGSAACLEAQESSAARHFGSGAPVIHCMGLNLAAVHSGRSWHVARVSDDHAYPGVEEDAASVARHLWHCAANGLWLGHFCCCDWDMFRTSEWHAGIQAVARAVSGGPIYVSDPAERLRPEVLAPLLLPDGSGRVVPCLGAGKLLGRQAFVDPTSSRSACFVANCTRAGWMAVAFGLCDAGPERLAATLLPADLEGADGRALACLQVELGGPGHAAPFTEAGWDVAVYHMNFSVLAVAPLLRVGGRAVAAFGLQGVWNSTGTLAEEPREAGPDRLWLQTLCAGKLLLWCDGACSLRVDDGETVAAPGGMLALPVPAGGFQVHVAP